jgi:hypothetical protein
MGFFIVDKRGMVRLTPSGPYQQEPGTGSHQARQLPSNTEILREVGKCHTSPGDTSRATPS